MFFDCTVAFVHNIVSWDFTSVSAQAAGISSAARYGARSGKIGISPDCAGKYPRSGRSLEALGLLL
jgi:hypothetical protein